MILIKDTEKTAEFLLQINALNWIQETFFMGSVGITYIVTTD
jgi:hypothetical protein